MSALDYLHQNGIAFRNLSNTHVMFDLKGNVKLVDFSNARILLGGNIYKRSRLRSGANCVYMAPEIICERCEEEVVNQGFEADIWSVGILVMEMMMRKQPYGSAANAAWHNALMCKMHHEEMDANNTSNIDAVDIILQATRDPNSNDQRSEKSRWSANVQTFLRDTLQVCMR